MDSKERQIQGFLNDTFALRMYSITDLGVSEWYICTKNALNNWKLSAIVYSVIYIAHVLKNFTIPLQQSNPMVTVLFPRIQKLLKELLFKFLKEDSILAPSISFKYLEILWKLDLHDTEIQNLMISVTYICREFLAFLFKKRKSKIISYIN